MPYNKGDFTQQGVAGDVSALVRLNEKRVIKVVLSSDDESSSVTIAGTIFDVLNNETYDLVPPSYMTLLKSESLGTITNSSGAAVDTTKTVVVNDINAYDVLLVLIVSAATENGTHKASFTEVMLAGGTTKTNANNITRNLQYVNGASGAITSLYNTGALGVYPLTANLSSGNVTMSIYSKDSVNTGTINAEYTAHVYGIKLIDLIRG